MTDLEVSKSARKRQASELQKVGRRLAELNARQLAQIALPDAVRQAIADYQRFASHGAKRRQLQFIGKLMRHVDREPISALLDTFDGVSAAAQYQFSQLERWRDRLIAEPAALTQYLDEHPHAERQRLKHKLQKIRTARTEEQQRLAARELFRILREFG